MAWSVKKKWYEEGFEGVAQAFCDEVTIEGAMRVLDHSDAHATSHVKHSRLCVMFDGLLPASSAV